MEEPPIISSINSSKSSLPRIFEENENHPYNNQKEEIEDEDEQELCDMNNLVNEDVPSEIINEIVVETLSKVSGESVDYIHNLVNLSNDTKLKMCDAAIYALSNNKNSSSFKLTDCIILTYFYIMMEEITEEHGFFI